MGQKSSSLAWPKGKAALSVALPCPNCGNAGEKREVLRAALSSASEGWATLLACEGCGSLFFDTQAPANYGAAPAGGRPALAFYLQQGAGVGGIAMNLAALDVPADSPYLEIGCGFGFGLDFAIRALKWRGKGLDPSPFAIAGREQLGLPIESRYLLPGEDVGQGFDVVMGSEVLEHVPDPTTFVATLRAALAPNGVLLLTTPAAEAVRPETPPGLLIPVLSVGYHLILQSARSLEALLRRAGFATVEVERIGASLLARATMGSPRWQREPATDRLLYRRYLADAMIAAEPGSDLWMGFAARSYREAVAARDLDTADVVYDELSRACAARFGFEPHEATSRPPPPIGTQLATLAEAEPLCLGGILLHRAWQRLHLGASGNEVIPLFDAAAEAADRLRAALRAIGSEDGDAEDVGWTARAEAAIAAAGVGAADLGARITAIPPAPGEDGAQRQAMMHRRCFVGLVNGGHFQAALPLAKVADEPMSRAIAGAGLADDELDALYCRATLELQRQGGDAGQALSILRAARGLAERALGAGGGGSAKTLFWPLVDAEILALRISGAEAAARELEDEAATRLPSLPGVPLRPSWHSDAGTRPR